MTDATGDLELIGLRHNYSEAALSYRHFSGLRFIIVSVYVALAGGLAGVALGVLGGPTPSANVIRIAAGGALLVSATFFTCEIACDRSRRYFISVMQSLERPLGYSTMMNFPSPPPFKASYAVRSLYIVNLIFWFWLICHGPV